jgi:hypothetical protein
MKENDGSIYQISTTPDLTLRINSLSVLKDLQEEQEQL